MTEDRLYEKFSTLKGLYSGYHGQVDTNRSYYNRSFGNELVPDRWKSRLTPLIPQTSRRSIDEPADHILTFPFIKIPVRPTDGNEASEEARAEIVRQACNAWWGHIARTQNVIGDARKPLLNEGKVAIRKVIKWHLLPDFPDKEDYDDNKSGKTRYTKDVRKYRAELEKLGKSEFLWDVQLLDNVSVYEDISDHRDPEYVYVSYQIYVEEARRRWPWIKGDKDDDGNDINEPEWHRKRDLDRVTYTEYWSKPSQIKDKEWEPGKFCQWIEQEKVHESDNPYPYIPVVIDDPGFGVNYKGATPEQKYVGMTQHAHDLFRAQAESRTNWLAVMRLSAFPIGIARNIPTDKEIIIGPGEIIDMDGNEGEPGSESLSWLSHPDIPQGVVALGDTLEREANATFKMDILGGVPQRGVDTATEADLNVRNAVSKLSGPIACLERVARKLTTHMLMDIELVLKAGVTLYGASERSTTPAEIILKPSDIGGFYEVHCTLTTSDQEIMQQSSARFWLEAYRINPGLSAQTALERGDVVDDPQAEFVRRAAEDIYFSEQMAMARIAAAAQDLNVVLQEAQANQRGAAGDESMFGPRADSIFEESVTQETPFGQEQIVEQAYEARDVGQRASQFR